MSFGSHNLIEEGEARGGACPLSRYLGWLPFWRARRKVGAEPRRKWVRAATWGAKGVAAIYVLACVKCIMLYIVVPSVIAWCGWGAVSGGTGSSHERASEPSSVPGAVSPEIGTSGADVSDAEELNAEAAR